MKNRFLTLSVVFWIGATCPSLASAQGRGFHFFKRKEAQEKSRWTVADWWNTKSKVNSMNMWLAMNRTNNLFELSMRGDRGSYRRNDSSDNTPAFNHWSSRVDAFSTIFGLRLQFQESSEQWNALSGAFLIRLFGTGLQNTQWLVGGGLNKLNNHLSEPEVKLESPFVLSALDIYLIKTLGIRGQYTHFFSKEDSSSAQWTGTSWEAGPFLDFGPVRVFGSYTEDVWKQSSPTKTKVTRRGFKGGLELFF